MVLVMPMGPPRDPNFIPTLVVVSKENNYADLFLKALHDSQKLQARRVISDDYDKSGRVFYVISAPREALETHAEKLKVAIPLNIRVNGGKETTMREKMMHYFSPCLQSGFFKVPYREQYRSHVAQHTFDGDDPIASSRIRSMLVFDLVSNIDITRYAAPGFFPPAKEYRGLRWLQSNGHVEEFFVLHDPEEVARLKCISEAGVASWFQSLSVTSLRNYLGEELGFVFAWRSAWLSNALPIPLILGIITFIYGLASPAEKSAVPALDLEHASSNKATPYYALAMCLWVALFTVIWSRFKYIYSFKWGSLNYFLLEERVREKAVLMRKLGHIEIWVLYSFTNFMTALLILLGVAYCLVMIYLQRILSTQLEGVPKLGKEFGESLASGIVSFVNALLVTCGINPLFEYFSLKLTNLERHYFESDYEAALIRRVFFNSFLNNNLRVLMMLIIPRFNLPNIFNGEKEEFEFCAKGKCSQAISYQVLFFLLARPFLSLIRFLWHGTKKFLWKSEPTDEVKRQYRLFEGLSFGKEVRSSIIEMNIRVAQYGFVVMFAASFPLAPLIAFIIELIVRRLDIRRYLMWQRRSVPRRQEGIGCWEELVDFVNMAAICTNVWIIAFRSEYGPELVIDWKEYFPESYEAMLSVVLISTLLLLTALIRASIDCSTIPVRVRLEQRREMKMAEKFLKAHDSTLSLESMDSVI